MILSFNFCKTCKSDVHNHSNPTIADWEFEYLEFSHFCSTYRVMNGARYSPNLLYLLVYLIPLTSNLSCECIMTLIMLHVMWHEMQQLSCTAPFICRLNKLVLHNEHTTSRIQKLKPLQQSLPQEVKKRHSIGVIHAKVVRVAPDYL